MSKAHLGIYKLSTDVIVWKIIYMSYCHCDVKLPKPQNLFPRS